jgi:hypothetical protein
MSPHGSGVTGDGNHSHDTQFPDDSWNLYAMLDPSTTALNVTVPRNSLGVFKPHARKLIEEPFVESDADAEIIFILRC